MKTEFFIFATILGWGLGSFLMKPATNYAHPIMISSISLCLYIILLPMMWLFIKFDHHITFTGVSYTLAAALCMCVGTLGFSYALRSGGSVGQTTILTALYPALTLMLSVIFLGENMTAKKGIGVVLALVSFILLGVK